MFASVELLIVHNPSKMPTFSLAQRVELAKASLAEVGAPSNIKVATLESGLLVEHARMLGAKAIIKGFRTASDIEYELPMSQVNRDLWSLPAISDDGYIAERVDLSLKGAQSDSTCSSDNGISEN